MARWLVSRQHSDCFLAACCRYLVRIEQGYQQTPYHSRIHAAGASTTIDVLHDLKQFDGVWSAWPQR